MSQFGMNMPGGQARRGPSLNVYTGLLFLAVVALATACGFMYVGASKLGLNGDPFTVQASAAKDIKFAK